MNTRLTIELNPELKNQFKSRVATDGVSLKTKLIELIRNYLETEKSVKNSYSEPIDLKAL